MTPEGINGEGFMRRPSEDFHALYEALDEGHDSEEITPQEVLGRAATFLVEHRGNTHATQSIQEAKMHLDEMNMVIKLLSNPSEQAEAKDVIAALQSMVSAQ